MYLKRLRSDKSDNFSGSFRGTIQLVRIYFQATETRVEIIDESFKTKTFFNRFSVVGEFNGNTRRWLILVFPQIICKILGKFFQNQKTYHTIFGAFDQEFAALEKIGK